MEVLEITYGILLSALRVQKNSAMICLLSLIPLRPQLHVLLDLLDTNLMLQALLTCILSLLAIGPLPYAI